VFIFEVTERRFVFQTTHASV